MRADAAAELLSRRRARQSLLDFCRYTWPEYETPAHILTLADRLEAVERGEVKRLIVTMPPRHGKSELVSLRFPCWMLGRHPGVSIVQAGYAESIALTHSRRARDIFVSPETRKLYPEALYRPERAGQDAVIPQRQAAHEWGTVQGGSYYAVGIGGGLTGRGFDVGILDDPTKDAEEAQSANIREKVWEWYRTVFRTRAAPGAAVIVVMTRWHHDDLVGRLLRLAAEDPQADQWEVLHLKAITDGQALWPERYPIEALEGIRTTIGSQAFASLYQGEPEIEGGNIVRREWWRYYRELPKCTRIIHSWDTAFKGGKTDDWSVCTVWGESETGYHLIDLWRGRVEFPELKRQVVALNDRDHPVAILVEDAASGQSLIQELRRGTRLPVLPVRPDRDKVSRLTAVTPLIEAGRVLLPERAPWLADYVDEMSAFPNGEHDDQVDSSSQALNWLALQPKRELFIGRAG
ncbi:MAG: phage terminase large subunit [Anaerovoracaceae bacterium]